MLGTWLGKVVRLATWWRPGGGHALPGLVVGRLVPGCLAALAGRLPEGVVLITGTNGKTTTTKMVVELVQAAGLRAVTNPTGSNLARGIVSSLVRDADWRGRPSADLAVFEVDEAYAARLVAQVRPRWVLALNISRDQLDRFGEVETVADRVGVAARAATEGVVTNADDPRLSRLGAALADAGVLVDYFGVAPELAHLFPRDDELVSSSGVVADRGPRPSPSVELVALGQGSASFRVADRVIPATLRVTGQHNVLNAAAALALTRHLVPAVGDAGLVERLGRVAPAFGRGQTWILDGRQLELVLVKNPAGFHQALASYLADETDTMIAINDEIADGRDVSWLWDVDVSALAGRPVAVTSGARAADMALRLGYSDIAVDAVDTDLDGALRHLAGLPGHRKLVLANYTAMVHLHATLRRHAKEAS